MKILTRRSLIIAVVLLLTACDSNGYRAPVKEVVVITPPPVVQKVDFNMFVTEQFIVDKNAEPTEINDIEFEINDQENVDAFNSIFNQ